MNRLERIIEKAERSARREEKVFLNKLTEILRSSERNLVKRLSELYTPELELSKSASRLYKEGRARSLLEQLSVYLNALESSRLNVLDSNTLLQAHEASFENARALMSVYDNLEFFKPSVNFEAIELQLKNSSARLKRHSKDAIEKINAAVVDGLVTGRSAKVVARDIRKATGYLRSRAETIALTELGTARAQARDQFYEENDVGYVQRYVTLDDRTCSTCAPRHGEITKRSETIEKLHPRCRCYLAPIRKSYLDAGLVDLSKYERERDELVKGLEQRKVKVNKGKAPFETKRPQQVQL